MPGVHVVYELPAVVPDVICDPVQIMQILMNLIRNAAEAILEHGSEDKTIMVSAKVGARTSNCLSATTAPVSAIP